MAPLDLLDRLLSWPYREFRGLPPNRMRIRIGVGNRILFNAAMFRLMPMNFWLDALVRGHITPTSQIVDLGCGCGRFAMPLRDFSFHGRGFEGTYFGVDVDDDMLEWCRLHFPAPAFRFHRVGAYSRTYNPRPASDDASDRFRLPLSTGSQDFVFANSLFSHLLADDFVQYLRESARVLRPGGTMRFSVFCLEHVNRTNGSRWSFAHRRGDAHIEDERYPEAAVGYSEAWLRSTCESAGFEPVELLPSEVQTMIVCRRAVTAGQYASEVEIKHRQLAAVPDQPAL